jgi:hypothetical protein
MTTGLADPAVGELPERFTANRVRTYFWSDTARRAQTVLGLLWLLDGGLQFQSFMYSRGFLQSLLAGASGEPAWLHASILWGVRVANGDLGLWNTLFAVTQVLIGAGLLIRPLARPALLASCGWALVVWWFGEAFGGLLAGMAQPLTGAPGGVLLYVLVGLLAWPGRPGGLLGIRGARTMWATLWLVMAYLWLLPASSAHNATRDALTSIPTGISGLNSIQSSLADASAGHGLVVALVLAAVSAVIGVGVAAGWHARGLLTLAIMLNLVYWVIPQGLGGLFAGGATDPNAGPLFVLLAAVMVPLFPRVSSSATATSSPPKSTGVTLPHPHVRRLGVLATGGLSAIALDACGSSARLVSQSSGSHRVREHPAQAPSRHDEL